MTVRRALLSVSEKRGLTKLARGLSELGISLISSSGTAKVLRAKGLKVTEVSKLTGFPEVLEGRVKTLHPAVHAGLLARRDRPAQLRQLKRKGLDTIDLVAVNLYPFEKTVNTHTPLDNALEQIDIGGETLIRAAAKNFPGVIVLVDPADYAPVLKQLKLQGDVDLDTRRALAQKAFAHITGYNAAITRYFDPERLPQDLSIHHPKALDLRYGENPQQQAALYGQGIEQLWGKGLSYTNVLDLECAWLTVAPQRSPAVSIVKHATPCGVALGNTTAVAYRMALDSDDQSAFGGVIGVNRQVGVALAKAIVSRFFEAVVAPAFSAAALNVLHTKKNLRLIVAPGILPRTETRSTAFGWLTQTSYPATRTRFKTVTQKQPTDAQRKDLRFAWAVVKHVKSNAIVLAKDRATVGIGAGQMSRVDAVRIAIEKAGKRTRGAVLASDGFFPFPDSIELAAKAGVRAIVQPGGSIRDEDVIAAADAHGITMALTGTRVFRH